MAVGIYSEHAVKRAQAQAAAVLQLPRQLQDKLRVGITSDPFSMRMRATFTAEVAPRRFRDWECVLEGEPPRIPEAFLARLCVEVP